MRRLLCRLLGHDWRPLEVIPWPTYHLEDGRVASGGWQVYRCDQCGRVDVRDYLIRSPLEDEMESWR